MSVWADSSQPLVMEGSAGAGDLPFPLRAITDQYTHDQLEVKQILCILSQSITLPPAPL